MLTQPKKILISLCLLATAIFTVAHAQSESDTDTLSTLLKNMHSMQANFSQTIEDKNGKALQKTSGRMSLQRPSQFRWETLQPNRQLIVTNGKRLWIYDPDLEQVTIRALVKAAGETPAMLLSDENLTLGKEFTVKSISSSSSMQWFNLIPHDKSSMISSLKLGFSNQLIREMQIQDHLGHSTRIQFSDIKINTPLAASLFVFKAPKGVDVIDETKR